MNITQLLVAFVALLLLDRVSPSELRAAAEPGAGDAGPKLNSAVGATNSEAKPMLKTFDAEDGKYNVKFFAPKRGYLSNEAPPQTDQPSGRKGSPQTERHVRTIPFE